MPVKRKSPQAASASSSRSARRFWLIVSQDLRKPGSMRSARISRHCARRASKSSWSRPARSPWAAPCSIFPRHPEARGKPGRRRRRSDCTRTRLDRKPLLPFHRRRPDPADAGRYGRAPPLFERPRDDEPALEARRRPDHQRERYGRNDRNPLRRQRSPRRPRGDHGRRRPAGSSLDTTGSIPPRRISTRTRS